MKKKDKRISEIIKILRDTPDISISSLSENFSVSEMTIRRDLKNLEEQKLLSVSRKLYSEENEEKNNYTLSTEISRHSVEKDRIGRFAATLIEPNDILILDAGSTTVCLSKHVPKTFPITIICNNLLILENIHNFINISIIFSGGYFHHKDDLFESTEGISLIKKHRAKKIFLSASGVHEKLGMTCGHSYEVLSKQAMIKSSYYKILLVDSSKFDIINSAFFAPWEEMDMIITDTGIPKKWINIIREQGIKLHIV